VAKSYLVIVESPGKIKKLKSILGADYEVIASMGHVMDLPPKNFGIDLERMEADYVVLKADVAKRLRSAAKEPYKVIYLASDPDREGEAISYHVGNLLKRANSKVQLQRVTFDAITPSAVTAAFKQPRALDQHLVAAQETRRLLDRLVGYPSSRFLWQFVQGKGLSAGRVQSVALRLVVERDDAIRNFVPREYWTITGLFRVDKGELSAQLSRWKGKKPDLKTRAEAESVVSALQGVPFRIGSVQPKQRTQKPPAPFTTSTLQQAASSHLHMSPDETMRHAQALYEAGLITYMRTDSPAVSPEGQAMAKQTILAQYGEKYVGNSQYKAKGNAQEAHECVRPTDTKSAPESVRATMDAKSKRTGDVYDLIYRRFLASQMAAAIYDELHVTVTGGEAVFSAKGSRLAFDGFLRVYNLAEEKEAKPENVAENASEDDEDETPTNKQLPPLTVNEPAKALKLTPQQHFTKPPAPYSEALLVKALEQHGVGRPSTYAQTVGTLKKRDYVKVEKKRLFPTDLGREVHGVLASKLPGLFEVPFTAQMEAALDEIAAGERESKVYLKSFWSQVSPKFGENVVQAVVTPRPATKTAGGSGTRRTTTRKASANAPTAGEGETAPKRRTKSPARTETSAKTEPNAAVSSEFGVCPKCGKALLKRTGRNGAFIGCSGFPKCRFTKNLA
jgi:DNA topoisomerase-1